MKNNRAPGKDLVPPEMLKGCDITTKENLFNKYIMEEIIPKGCENGKGPHLELQGC